MFIIRLLSQHVSGIIMPIIRRTRVCTAAYGVLHWLCWLWLCGAGTQAHLVVMAVVVWSWDASTQLASTPGSDGCGCVELGRKHTACKHTW